MRSAILERARVATLRENLKKSLWLDWRTLRCGGLPRSVRMALIVEKWIAIGSLAVRHQFAMGIHSTSRYHGTTVSELGVLQSCIVDVYDELVTTGIASQVRRAIDVGANCGQWTTAFKLFAKHAEVHALEPDPDTYRTLTRNLARLVNVSAYNVAAGASNGMGLLYRHELSVMSSQYPANQKGYDMANPIRTPVRRLDDVLDTVVDLIKIDVEGAEGEVIKGATRLLGQARYLVVEVALWPGGGEPALGVLSQIESVRPGSHIVKFGRPLGSPRRPLRQDVVIRLGDGKGPLSLTS